MDADHIARYKAIAIVASFLGLFTACGLGSRSAALPQPPPPPLEPAASEIDLSPNPLQFEPTIVGFTSSPQTLIIANHGTLPISFRSVLVDSYHRPFRLQNQTCTAAPLAPEGQCTITVVFRPQVARQLADNLYIHSLGATQPFVVKLKGLGVEKAQPPSGPTDPKPRTTNP